MNPEFRALEIIFPAFLPLKGVLKEVPPIGGGQISNGNPLMLRLVARPFFLTSFFKTFHAVPSGFIKRKQ